MKTSSVALATGAAKAATASLDGPTQRFPCGETWGAGDSRGGVEWRLCHTNLYPLAERLFV